MISDEEVVISGISGRLPESDTIDEFRDHLLKGEDMVTENGRRWDPGLYGLPKRSGKLKELTKFDAAFFGVHPKQANVMDPQLRLLLEVTYEALFDAGVNPQTIRGSRTGVFVGCNTSESFDPWIADPERINGYEMIGCTLSMFANRLSYFFDFIGPSYAVDTACSSSMVALDHALRAIRMDLCDAAIVAGSNLCIRPTIAVEFLRMGVLSYDGVCKTFDATGNGYCRSEAVVAIFLQKQKDAKRIYATLVHSSGNTDGYKERGITSPSGEMQKRLMQKVYAEAGVDPVEVSFVELHGTGTAAGDPEETNAVADVFCPPGRRTEPLLIGALKSNTGHPEPASGLTAIAKALIIIHGGKIPQNLHYQVPNPAIPGLLDGRLKVVETLTDFKGRYVGVNSFGFGGTNVHALLRVPDRKSPATTHPAAAAARLVTCAGRTKEWVERTLQEVVANPENIELQALVEESTETSLITHVYRGFAVVNSSNTRQTVEKISSFEARPIWFIFSGMGTQWPQMGRDLMVFDPFRVSIMRSDAALSQFGINLYDLLNGTDEKTFRTFSGVGIVCIQVALVDLLRTLGIEPNGIIGHSIGEHSCGYGDGVLTADETVIAAYWRCLSVSEAKLPPGAMAALGLTWEEAKRRCPEGVVPACHNAPDSVTISGPAESVEKFVAELQREGVFARSVDSSGVASHSYFMNVAAPVLKERLEKVIPATHKRTPRWVRSAIPESEWDSELGKLSIGDYLVHNLVSPVLFKEALDHVQKNAIVVEISPHCLLQSVLRRGLDSGCTILGLMDKRQPDNVLHLLSTLGKMYNAGVNFNPLALYPPVQFPVSPTTPMMSSLVRWDHSATWDVPTADDFIALGSGGSGSGSSGAFEIDVNTPGSEDAYLSGHVIEGRIILPASGYIMLAWKQLARMSNQAVGQTPVTFEDVHIHSATVIPATGTIKLHVVIAPKTGQFEISDEGTLLASGIVYFSPDDLSTQNNTVSEVTSDSTQLRLQSDDAYRELRLRGYEYGPTFHSIHSIDGNISDAELLWSGNWVIFLDGLLQMDVLTFRERDLRLPTRIRSLHINPLTHEQGLQTLGDGRKVLRATYDQKLATWMCGGVEMVNTHFTLAPRRQDTKTAPFLDYQLFVPYNESQLASYAKDSARLAEYAKLCNSFVLKNLQQLVDSGVKSGLKNADLLRKLVANGTATQLPREDDLLKFREAGDSVVLKAAEKIFAVPRDDSFENSVNEIVKSSWSDLVTGDLLTGFMRSDRCFKTLIDVVLENALADSIETRMKVVECDADVGQSFRHVVRQLSSQPMVNLSYVAATQTNSEPMDQDILERHGISTVEWSLNGHQANVKSLPDKVVNADVVILSNVLHRHPNIQSTLSTVVSLLRDNGFLLVLEPTSNFAIPWTLFALTHDVANMSDIESRSCGPFCDEQTWLSQFTAAGLETVAVKSDGLLNTAFLCRKISKETQSVAPTMIDVNDPAFSWIEDVKAVIGDDRAKEEAMSSVWLKTDAEYSGIVGLMNCIRKEPNGTRLRCLFNSEIGSNKPKPLTVETLREVQKKDLVMNVFRDGIWGSFRHLPLGSTTQQVESTAAYVNVITRGDLSSLRWIESPLKHFVAADHPELQRCRVHYAALNFRDIMLAAGKLPPDAIPDDPAYQDCLLGMEISGYDDTNRRVMGLLAAKGLATDVDVHRSYLWKVPDDWTLEQAATIPIAYATVFYALVARGRIHAGETVLIHSGSGAVGQAAIAVALSRGCRVLTTVGTAAKRAYLRERFPQLTDDSFADSHDSNFWRTVMRVTAGRGVDVVLNSLAGDKLQSSVRLLAQHGRFLEIGKFDLSNNNPLGMATFLRNISFHGIMLDALFKPGTPDWPTVYNLVADGIRDGVVRPLQTTVFERDDIESAFRYMAQGKHIGKVLIKVRDEAPSSSSADSIMAVARTFCNPRRSYIITGGLGGFGLELAQWLVDRGARHLVLTSRTGVRTGYQDSRVRHWRRKGVDVTVSTRNVADAGESMMLVREAAAKAAGGVGGVFHLAVVARDGLTVNQTAEQWIEVADVKVNGIVNLDAATRQMCGSTLDWFVVWSSSVSGRGNAGNANYGYANSAMEHVCEQRRNDGLPGLAIQWGTVADVGLAIDIFGVFAEHCVGGTYPQRISSCLATLDSLLCLPHPVVSCFLLPESTRGQSDDSAGTGSLRQTVARILGIRDATTVNPDLTIGDLGLDSLMTVELKQTLERDYSLSMNNKDIRALTFTRIDQLSSASADKSPPVTTEQPPANAAATGTSKPSTTNGPQVPLPAFIPTEPVVEMNDVQNAPVNLFVIHPIEGSVFTLLAAMSRMKCAKVYGLQCDDGSPLTSFEDLAAEYINRMRAIQPAGPYRIAGYSFGAGIAIEMALQLQKLASTSTSGVACGVSLLILLEASHASLSPYTGKTKDNPDVILDVAKFESELICKYVSIMTSTFADNSKTGSRIEMDKLAAEIANAKDFESRARLATTSLRSSGLIDSSAAEKTERAMQATLRRIIMAGLWKPATNIDASTRVVLVRASESFTHARMLGPDYGLSEVCRGKVDVHIIKGSHESIVQPAGDGSCRLVDVLQGVLNV